MCSRQIVNLIILIVCLKDVNMGANVGQSSTLSTELCDTSSAVICELCEAFWNLPKIGFVKCKFKVKHTMEG